MATEELRTQLKEAFNKAAAYKKELQQKISTYDLQQQDLLHYMENETCDAVDLVKIAAKLKQIRAERRVLKIEYERIQSVTDPFANVKIHWDKDLAKFAEKTYANKTNILDDITLSHKNNKTK